MRTLLLATLLALAGTARANVDEERKIAGDHLAEQIKDTNAACGTSIVAVYDWKSETKKPADNAGQGALACRDAAKGIADLCGDHADAKAKLAKVKKLSCRFDASVTTKKSDKKGIATDVAGTPPVPHTWIELDGGTLGLAFDWQLSNTRSEIEHYLAKAL
jgi:hypothetical protein